MGYLASFMMNAAKVNVKSLSERSEENGTIRLALKELFWQAKN